MSEIVSTFSRVKVEDFNYLFFVVASNDYWTPIREQLNNQLLAFGQDLGVKGKVVSSYERASYQVYEELMRKNWKRDFKESLRREHEPFMLIIDVDFAEFDPQKHHWGIIRFSGYPVETIPRMFYYLALITKKDKNIFRFLRTLTLKSTVNKAAQYFEIKPEIFGVSINVNALIDALTKP